MSSAKTCAMSAATEAGRRTHWEPCRQAWRHHVRSSRGCGCAEARAPAARSPTLPVVLPAPPPPPLPPAACWCVGRAGAFMLMAAGARPIQGATMLRAKISPNPSMTPLMNGRPTLIATLASSRKERRRHEMPGVKRATVSDPEGAYEGCASRGGGASDVDDGAPSSSSSSVAPFLCRPDRFSSDAAGEGERDVRRGRNRGAPVADTVGTVSVCGTWLCVVCGAPAAAVLWLALCVSGASYALSVS